MKFSILCLFVLFAVFIQNANGHLCVISSLIRAFDWATGRVIHKIHIMTSPNTYLGWLTCHHGDIEIGTDFYKNESFHVGIGGGGSGNGGSDVSAEVGGSTGGGASFGTGNGAIFGYEGSFEGGIEETNPIGDSGVGGGIEAGGVEGTDGTIDGAIGSRFDGSLGFGFGSGAGTGLGMGGSGGGSFNGGSFGGAIGIPARFGR